nr:hypothetical protein BDOA9_0120550 [Bradyrhizobium sp. DOA9]
MSPPETTRDRCRRRELQGCCQAAVSSLHGRGHSPFIAGRTRPIFASWRRNLHPPKNPANPPNPKRIVPMCNRSGRRWPNCSIPRSIAAMRAWDRAPACSRRRTIRATAAPGAKPPRIAHGLRRRRTSPATAPRG